MPGSVFLQRTLDGAMVGASYALLGLGFTLIFGILRRLNLSYGPSILAGLYVGIHLHITQGAGLLVTVAAALAGTLAVGLYVERICFAALRGRSEVASMIASFALWMQIEEATTLVLPRHSYPFPSLAAGDDLEFAGLTIRADHAVQCVIAVMLGAALYALLYRSRFGLAVRAVIDSPTAAGLMGIRIAPVTVAGFLLASLIGGVGGVLIAAVDGQVMPMFGLWASLKGLIAMMLGGIGSLPGAVVGGVVLGIAEAHGQGWLGAQFRDLTAFGLLFAVLMTRPHGLLGRAA